MGDLAITRSTGTDVVPMRKSSHLISEVAWKSCKKFLDDHVQQIEEIERLTKKLVCKNKEFGVFLAEKYPNMLLQERSKYFCYS